MISIGEQRRYSVGSERIVVTANRPPAIDQDDSRAVDWHAFFRAPIVDGELESVTR